MSLRSEIIRILNEVLGNSKKITQLPAGTTPSGTELIEGVQGGESVSFTISQVSSGGSGVLSVVAGTNVTVDDTDPQNPIISASGGGGGVSDWGDIGGTLSDQTDLQSALDAKQNDITFGTGVQTALGVNVGTAGSPVVNGGALGTPSSGLGTNITGIVGTNVTNTPAGNIAATTVQAAINELDTEKQATLVSGSNIKTVNGLTQLTSGNLVVPEKVGDLYSETFSSLAAYTSVGSPTTAISGGLDISGGAGTFAKYVYRTGIYSSWNYCYRRVRFQSTTNATTEGIAIGFISVNAFVSGTRHAMRIAMDTSGGAARGTVYIHSLPSTGSDTVVATSANKLTYTNGDTIEIYYVYYAGNNVVSVKNITTNSEPVYVSYYNNGTYNNLYGSNSCVAPAIFTIGGAQKITLDVFGTDEYKNPLIVRTGDSIQDGAFAGPTTGREANLTAGQLLGRTVVFSAGGNGIDDINNGFSNIVLLNPKYVTIMIGANEASYAVALGTTSTPGTFAYKMQTFINNCETNGIIPILLYATPCSSGSGLNTLLNSYNAFLTSQWGAKYLVIDWATQLKNGAVLNTIYDSGDGVHINALGNAKLSEYFIANVKILPRFKAFGAYPNITFDGAVSTLDVGSSASSLRLQGDFAGSGSLPAGAILDGGNTGGLSILSSPNGATGNKVVGAYYVNNTFLYKSAIEWANVASGLGNLQLMKDGGTVSTPSTATLALAGPMTTSNTIVVGATDKLTIFGDQTATGDLPTGAGFSGANTGGLYFLASPNGAAGNKVIGGYFNGTAFKSAIEWVNVASGFANVLLLKGGGNVGIGQATPTAKLHLAAGTATASTAPIKLASGTNLTTAEAGAIEFDGTNLFFSPSTVRQTVMKALVGSATLDFGSTPIAAGGNESLTITVTGAADGDEVILGVPNASFVAGVIYTARVSATNTVSVQAVNSTASPVDPASGTFKVSVIKR